MRLPGSNSMRLPLRTGLVAALAVVVFTAGATGVAASAATAPVSGGPTGSGVCATQAVSVRTGATVATIRAFADCEIARRQTTLESLSRVVAASAALTSSDAAALAAKIGADRSGLAALKATIGRPARPASLRVQVVQIVSGFRIYVLLGPQVRLTVAADGVVALKPHFDGISATLTDRIAGAAANGKDVGAAQADLDAMNAAVANAVALAGPLPARLLALTPAAFNSGTAQATLKSARTAILKARDLLKAAAKDGRSVLADLK